MTVTSMLALATAHDEVRFAVSVTGGPVRVVYSTEEPAPGVAMASPSYSGSTAVDAQGAAKVTVGGLTARTRYWWRVEDDGVEDTSRTGTLITPPQAGVQASFTFAASGDAGQTPVAPGFTGTEQQPERISNFEIHRHLGERMVEEDWVAHLSDGDDTYYDLGNTGAGFPPATLANYRQMYSDLQLQPNQRALYDSGSYIYTWDDHDYGPNDSDGDFPEKAYPAQVYRERVPHHDLPDPDGAIYRSLNWGRALVVLWDCRFHRSPASDPDGPSKTMLGSAQKAWFQALIETTSAEVIFIMSSVQWMSGGAGGWAGYQTERQEIADMIVDAGKAHKVIMFSADAHVNAIDTGRNNAWGGWPCCIFAPRDATTGTLTDATYDILAPTSIRGQYGTFEVADLGGLIAVKMTAWLMGTAQASYTKTFATPSPLAAVDVTEIISGSHEVIAEARICETYQTGPDPDGVPILLTGGDVKYDETAAVWSTAAVTTDGADPDTGRSRFPRRADDFLYPDGRELYIRYGIRLGDQTLWTPMGYYRLDDVDQDGTVTDLIDLGGPDRWMGLVGARLITPRQYFEHQSIAAVVYDLLFDVYPDAVVAWDDDTPQLPLGRTLLVEKDRAAALRDIATSYGKVVYFDSLGVLRFESVPDPEQIVWDIKAGANGVKSSMGRSISTATTYNGVMASGSSTDGTAIAVAVDVGEHSPTRWGSRFGKRVREWASPLILDDAAAYSAASSILARSIGIPKKTVFGTVPNPALRPRQAVRITQTDHNRERHIVSKLTIPVVPKRPMAGDTREQTLVRIGRVIPGSPDA